MSQFCSFIKKIELKIESGTETDVVHIVDNWEIVQHDQDISFEEVEASQSKYAISTFGVFINVKTVPSVIITTL